MTNRLPATAPVTAGDLDAAHVAQESCRTVGTPGFYLGRKVGADYVGRFTPVMEQQLEVAGARVAAILNRVSR